MGIWHIVTPRAEHEINSNTTTVLSLIVPSPGIQVPLSEPGGSCRGLCCGVMVSADSIAVAGAFGGVLGMLEQCPPTPLQVRFSPPFLDATMGILKENRD